MSTPKLKPFSYVVLALVGDHGAGAHDIAAMMARSPVYWAAARSQWFAEPKRLETLGLLAAQPAPGRTHARTYYTLTDAGREALRDWLARPARFTRMQNEPAIRLLAGDLIDDRTIVHSLRGLREEIEQLDASLQQSLQIAEQIPARARYLTLSHSLARRILDAHRDWIEEIERELDD
jgi:PadR family transcriptional regulator AphA